jgi:hypothetical protein
VNGVHVHQRFINRAKLDINDTIPGFKPKLEEFVKLGIDHAPLEDIDQAKNLWVDKELVSVFKTLFPEALQGKEAALQKLELFDGVDVVYCMLVDYGTRDPGEIEPKVYYEFMEKQFTQHRITDVQDFQRIVARLKEKNLFAGSQFFLVCMYKSMRQRFVEIKIPWRFVRFLS